jgi:TRAP-type uncharacterized transport system substrate-binding protein
MVTTVDRSDDEVYDVTRAIFENMQELATVVWSKYWSEASISSIANLIALITVPVPHRRPG